MMPCEWMRVVERVRASCCARGRISRSESLPNINDRRESAGDAFVAIWTLSGDGVQLRVADYIIKNGAISPIHHDPHRSALR